MHSAVVSTTLSQSSGSKSSLLSGSGYGNPYGSHSRKGLEGIGKGSTPNLHHPVFNPSEYSIPGVMPGTHISYAVAGARIYHNTQQITQSNHSGAGALSFGRNRGSSKDKSQWVYSYLKGTLVFGQDTRPSGLSEETMTIERITAAATSSSQDDGPRGDYWFQLVDDETEKVVWKFKVPLNANKKFNYEFDRPFFHVFQGSSRKYGFLFDDDKEANVFLNEVNSRVVTAVGLVSPPAKTMKSLPRNFSIRSNKKSRKPPSPAPAPSPSPSPSPPLPPSKPSVVSSATTASLKRLAHIGFNQTNECSRPVEI